MTTKVILAVAALAAFAAPLSATAEELATARKPEAVRPADRLLELSVGAQDLTAGYPSWRDTTLRGIYEVDAHVLQAELSAKREFDESGVFFGLSDTYTINADWYASLAVGAGDGAFYLPQIRADAFVYRKWLAKKNLVSSVGFGYYDAPDGHRDRSLTLAAIYYFDAPWVVEAGVRLNRSDPGSVDTHRQFIAATYGRHRQSLISVRYGWGGEGYQAIGENTSLVDFQSNELSVMWRRWVTPRAGFLVNLERYRNSFYTRSGVSVGIFKQFD